VKFENCRFLGFKDTLYPHGRQSRQYYKNCYIEGTVDFIFGRATAFFEDCEIFCKSPGYITAASTEQDARFGFVFKNCKITSSAEKGTAYLGRPWRPDEKKKTAFYAEYGSSGKGANPLKEWNGHISLQKKKLKNIA